MFRTPLGLQFVQGLFDGCFCRVDAGQMGHGGHTALFHFGRDCHRFPNGRTAGTVRDTDKIDALCGNLVDDVQRVSQLPSFLRRKQFTRQPHVVALQLIKNLHDKNLFPSQALLPQASEGPGCSLSADVC
jgi:hypothetical protein